MKTATALVFLSACALAATSSAATAPKLTLGDIPEATLPAIPPLEKRPQSIPASATLSDLRVDNQAGTVAQPAMRGLSSLAKKGGAIAPSPAPALQASVSGSASEACVSVVAHGRETFRTTQIFLDPSEGVLPIRIESVKETAGGAELEILDAWVDPVTHGAMEIKRQHVPLKRAASGPLGAAAYAFRSGGAVTLVIPAGMNSQLVDSEGRFITSSCQVARGELKVERGKGTTLTGFFTRMTVAEDAKDGLAATPAVPIRIGLSASASQLSADPDPVLSVQLRALDEVPAQVQRRRPGPANSAAIFDLAFAKIAKNWAERGPWRHTRGMDSPAAQTLANGVRGEVRFVDAGALARVRGPASAASMLLVDMGPLGPSARGQLAELFEGAVEEAIQARGAAPPGVGASSDWDASLSDQLYRARHVGVRGFVVAVGPLEAVAAPGGVLDPEDSAALRFWAEATRERPVVLLLEETLRELAGYRAPVRIDELLGIPEPSTVAATPAPATPAPAVSPPPPAPVAEEPRAVEAAPVAAPPAVADRGEWRAHAEELRAARGPKPLAQIERLFVTKYIPLADAELRGVTDAPARAIRAEWAQSFAKSYGESFAAIRVTGKRPTMVFDAPNIAARVARLHGARSVELLMVDGMRFDLGLRIHERLRKAIDGRATCAERMLLWSALPSTTATQLDLLAHGLEGLSRPLGDESDVVARGRSVGTLRRVKVGARDLLKLDSVEARLRDAGGSIPERLDTIADEASAVIARHMESLPDRTLLFVFGDHGFLLDAGPTGSNPARQGGASPEEVLVPGFAWLTGGVH